MLTCKWAFLFVALGVLAIVGCQKAADPAPAETAPEEVETVVAMICGGCGQIKGSETCCAADATACEKCGLVAGSPGCCKITKGTDAELCGKCGQIKGTDACCAPDAEKCAECGLAKGSPGCCVKPGA